MKTSADIALAAAAIAADNPLIGFPSAWSAGEAAVRALDDAGRLAATAADAAPTCEDCYRTYTGPGRICPSCRRAEDGPYDDVDVHEHHALADLEDQRMEALR